MGTPLADQALLVRLRTELSDVMPKVLARATQIVRAKRWSRGSNLPEGNEASDLVHESIRLVLEGDRAWPPGLALDVFLVGIVRSLAGHLAEGPANRHDDFDPDIADSQHAKDPERPPAPNPEELVLQKHACEQLVAEAFSFAGEDSIINKIIEAVMEGHVKADDIAEAKCLSPKEVYEGTRRLHRRISNAGSRRVPS